MKIPDKVSAIHVIYVDENKESFVPCSKVDEFEECYEFEQKQEKSDGEEVSMVVLMRSEIRAIRFVKG